MTVSSRTERTGGSREIRNIVALNDKSHPDRIDFASCESSEMRVIKHAIPSSKEKENYLALCAISTKACRACCAS
ncbi:MAG: hypothetical protein ABI865_07360, partial [Nitrosospira sp.]